MRWDDNGLPHFQYVGLGIDDHFRFPINNLNEGVEPGCSLR